MFGAVPTAPSTSLHVVRIEDGIKTGCYRILDDFVQCTVGQGISMFEDHVVVLGAATQTLHILKLDPESGALNLVRKINGITSTGTDRALVEQQEEEEARTLSSEGPSMPITPQEDPRPAARGLGVGPAMPQGTGLGSARSSPASDFQGPFLEGVRQRVLAKMVLDATEEQGRLPPQGQNGRLTDTQ